MSSSEAGPRGGTGPSSAAPTAPPTLPTASADKARRRSLEVLSSELLRRTDAARHSDGPILVCPIGNGDAHIDLGAEGGIVWCDCEHDPADVEAALKYMAGALPLLCTDLRKGDFGHVQGCQRCKRWNLALDRAMRAVTDRFGDAPEDGDGGAAGEMWVRGGAMFDLPPIVPLFGSAEAPLSAAGQAWMIAGPDGTGKTSIACQYVKARLALSGWAGSMWGLPVAPLPPGKSVAYLAMDRPRQFMEGFMRGLNRGDHFAAVDRGLHVHPGPPPYLLSTERGQAWLLGHVHERSAGLLVIDSRKDLGSVVDSDGVSGVNRCVQMLVAQGVEVLVLAHVNKGASLPSKKGPPRLDDISGLGDVFHGFGSVLILQGRAGDGQVRATHVKPIRDLREPFAVLHDHGAGRSGCGLSVDTDGEGNVAVDVVGPPVKPWWSDVLRLIGGGPDGVSAREIAELLSWDDISNASKRLRPMLDAKWLETVGKARATRYRRGPEAPETA